MKRSTLRHELTFFFFISPWLLGTLLFVVFPFLASFAISLTNYTLLSDLRPVGLLNYRSLFSEKVFWASVRVSLIYTCVVAPGRIALALFIAVLLNRRLALTNIFRSIFYIPAIASTVAVTLLWQSIFNADFGLLNSALQLFGVKGPGWLISQSWALPSLIIMSLWNIGVPMVVFLAGLQSIPPTLYEVASLDGAGPVRRFFHVTIPMLSPILFFNLVLQVIATFQTFTEVYVLTGGGPGDSTRLLSLLLYTTAFRYFTMGRASAIGWLLFMLLLAINLALFRSSRKWVFYAME